MHKSLTQDQHVKRTSCLLNELSFITKMPSGKETGHFLSIDLGSTNFRVILSDLKGGKGEDEFQVKYYDVPHNLRYGPTCKVSLLLMHFQSTIFILTHDLSVISASFYFPRREYRRLHPFNSFPRSEQSSVSSILFFLSDDTKVSWLWLPRGMDQKLRSAGCNQQGRCDSSTRSNRTNSELKCPASYWWLTLTSWQNVNCEVAAILNDSTGTLLKGAYLSEDCRVGMIFGSGFNCAFLESVSSISKLSEEDRHTLASKCYPLYSSVCMCKLVTFNHSLNRCDPRGCWHWVRCFRWQWLYRLREKWNRSTTWCWVSVQGCFLFREDVRRQLLRWFSATHSQEHRYERCPVQWQSNNSTRNQGFTHGSWLRQNGKVLFFFLSLS